MILIILLTLWCYQKSVLSNIYRTFIDCLANDFKKKATFVFTDLTIYF